MGTLNSFQEYNPTVDPMPGSPMVGVQNDAYPLQDRPRQPYQTYARTGQAPYNWSAGAAYDRYHGQAYDCVKMQTGLQNTCDNIYWMAPGRPIDQGTFNKLITSGNALQRRTVVSSLNAAATAPYKGVYTGLQGYVDLLEGRG